MPITRVGLLWLLALTANAQTPSKGITIFPLPSGASAQGIVTGPDGALWFIESSPAKLGRIDNSGAVTEFALPAAVTNPGSRIIAATGGTFAFSYSTGVGFAGLSRLQVRLSLHLLARGTDPGSR